MLRYNLFILNTNTKLQILLYFNKRTINDECLINNVI